MIHNTIKKIVVIWCIINTSLFCNIHNKYLLNDTKSNKYLLNDTKSNKYLLNTQINFIHKLYYSNYENKCQLIYIGGVESSFGVNIINSEDTSYGPFHILGRHAKHYGYTYNEFKYNLMNDFDFNVRYANKVYNYFTSYHNSNNSYSINNVFKSYNCGHNIDGRQICEDYLSKIKSMDIYIKIYAPKCQLYSHSYNINNSNLSFF